MKIISVVGARPQFIKLAPLSREIRKYHYETIIHTGQHYDNDMSDSFFIELEIPLPDYNLGIKNGNHGEQTGRMLIELEKVIITENPSLIIYYGDTNTTLAAALVAAKLQIPSIHIESGLRSYNKNMPEEINRIAVDHIADHLFAPTESAMKNLADEGLSSKAYLTGDIMVDSHKAAVAKTLNSKLIDQLTGVKGEFYLLTLHRPYNVDDPQKIGSILKELNKLDKQIVFPVHPRTKKNIGKFNLSTLGNIIFMNPVGYLDFVHLQINSEKIITDSGGIQKEAYFLKKPCITLRSETEWIETVKSGWNLLIDPDLGKSFSQKIESFKPPGDYKDLFGTNVATRMMEIINSI